MNGVHDYQPSIKLKLGRDTHAVAQVIYFGRGLHPHDGIPLIIHFQKPRGPLNITSVSKAWKKYTAAKTHGSGFINIVHNAYTNSLPSVATTKQVKFKNIPLVGSSPMKKSHP